ncbi:L,D-transpeptidase, partial [Rhizobium ruizarguesonis]
MNFLRRVFPIARLVIAVASLSGCNILIP